EVDLGVPLGVASTTRFVRLVGPARAKEIILECRRYGAEEARAMGLVHRIVPGSDLMKHAREHAQMLLAKPFRPLSEMKARTNACSLSCGYCPTFCGGNVPRVSLSPDETARTFMDVHRKGLASGLFLTSGVPGRPERATDRMLATLDLLRRREGFGGYVHIKLLPGAEPAQVEEAARLANRISVNLEGPSDDH